MESTRDVVTGRIRLWKSSEVLGTATIKKAYLVTVEDKKIAYLEHDSKLIWEAAKGSVVPASPTTLHLLGISGPLLAV